MLPVPRPDDGFPRPTSWMYSATPYRSTTIESTINRPRNAGASTLISTSRPVELWAVTLGPGGGARSQSGVVSPWVAST